MAGRSLGRIAGDVFGYVLLFQAAPEDRRPDFPALRSQLLSLIDGFARHPDAARVPPEEVEEARFALVAWVDEMIQRSNWRGREDWKREPLQLQLYRTNRAGNEFYDHLAALRPDQNEAREVYVLCLALGLEGQYAGHDADRRALLQKEFETLRVAGKALVPSQEARFVPAAYQLSIRLPDLGRRGILPTLAVMALVSGVFFGGLWLWLRWVVGDVPVPPGS